MNKTNQEILRRLKTRKPQISLIGRETRNTLTALLLKDNHYTKTNCLITDLKTVNALNAHIIILQLNPITENHLIKTLTLSHIHQPIFFLFDSNLPYHLINTHIPQSILRKNTSFFINSNQAINAIQSYQHNLQPSTAIDQLRQSGLIQLSQAIHHLLNNLTQHNHIQVALSLLELALSHTSERLLRISDQINLIHQHLYNYQLRLNKLNKIASHQIHIPYPKNLTTIVKNLHKQLAFFRLPFISHRLGLLALKNLEEINQIEKHLIFQAGKIKLLQESAQEIIEELVEDPILKQYRTETEVNWVLQLRRQNEVVFTQGRGSVGIFAERKGQLIGQGGPLHLLQTKANSIIRNNLIAGFGLSVFSFSNYLSMPLYDSLISSHHHQPTLSIFLLVSIIYLSQASWVKSLNAFTNDLARWNLSLKNNLMIQHQKMVEELVNLSVRPSSLPPESGSGERAGATTEGEVDLIASMRDRIEAKKEVTQEERAQLKAAHPVLAPLLDNHPGPLTFLELTHLIRHLILDLKQSLDHHQSSP